MQKIAIILLIVGALWAFLLVEPNISVVIASDCDYLKTSIQKEHNLQKRRALYRQAIEVCRDDVQLRYSYAYELERFRKYPEAIEQYKIVLKLDPKMVKALFNLGDIYKSQKQYSKAVEFYKMGLKLEHGNTRIQHNLEEASMALGKK